MESRKALAIKCWSLPTGGARKLPGFVNFLYLNNSLKSQLKFFGGMTYKIFSILFKISNFPADKCKIGWHIVREKINCR